mmetsp:Transcript_27114/g.39698  ORF Transcript_27114/g.39698 Transcript_27114/m.39698 type:complete len:244 (-) Transcript_27114:2351-3082(-)
MHKIDGRRGMRQYSVQLACIFKRKVLSVDASYSPSPLVVQQTLVEAMWHVILCERQSKPPALEVSTTPSFKPYVVVAIFSCPGHRTVTSSAIVVVVAHHGCHQVLDRLECEWFRYEPIPSNLLCLLSKGVLYMGRQEDNLGFLLLLSLFLVRSYYTFCRFQSTHNGHFHIHQNQIVGRGRSTFHSLGSIVYHVNDNSLRHRRTFLFLFGDSSKHPLQDFLIHHVVFCNQNAQRSTCTPFVGME